MERFTFIKSETFASALNDLIRKYNVPGPRYTSYPTVPYWDTPPTAEQWKNLVKQSFDEHNDGAGISLYVHLPYCESLCTFCGCNTRITVNHNVEEPYINALLKEWNMYCDLFGHKPRISEIHLGGGTPTFFSPKNLQRLIDGLHSTATVMVDADLGLEANPRTTTAEHLRTMAALGFTRLSLGVQDFDPIVQKAIHRVQSVEHVKSVTDEARAAGFTSINYDLVYGLPFQTEESIRHTINEVCALNPDRIAYYSYAHVPWVKPGQRSFTEMDLPDGGLKHRMYALGKQMLTEAGYLEIGMDHFARPEEKLSIASRNGTLHRNFMGYTTQKSGMMIGIGVSSISDTWTAFAQNQKTVEGYMDSLSRGELPIFRGHVLAGSDLYWRRIILDIMCRFEANLLHEEMESSDLLHEMESDGLVQRERGRIAITEKGRPFVRNVCMAFDQRLRQSAPETQIFSMTV